MLNRPVATIASSLAGILMLLAIAACGDTPTPRPTIEINPPPSPTPTIQLEPTPTSAPTLEPIPIPTLTPTPTLPPTEAPAEFALALTDETTWSDVFDLLAPDEQDCIDQAMGAELDGYLNWHVFTSDGLGGWEAEIYSCISPDKSTKLFTGALVLALEYEGADPSDEEIACIEAWAADKDLAYVVRQIDEDEAIIEEVFLCVVDSFVRLMVKEFTESFELEGEDAQCVEDVFGSLSDGDKNVLIFGTSNAELDKVWEQMWSCIPEVYGYDDGDVEHYSQGVHWSDPEVGRFVSIDAGYQNTCGIREGGEAVCWGSDVWGVNSSPDISFKSVSVSEAMACGLDEDGQIVCWGDHYPEADFPHGVSFSSIDIGPSHSCGIVSDDKSIRCWGDNSVGQIGRVPDGEFTAVTIGANHICAIRVDGNTICWGESYGEIGVTSPIDVPLISISAGSDYTCGLAEGGLVFCWNDYTGENPPRVPFLAVDAAHYYTCGLVVDGSVTCWGFDEIGIEPPDAVLKELTTAFTYACGIASDGRVACWGWGSSGEHVPPGAKLPE